MKNLPSGFGIKQIVTALEARPDGTPKGRCKKSGGLPGKEHMVDLVLFAMVIASAVSLVVVSPRQAQQETLRALRNYEDMLALHAYGPDEDSKVADAPAEFRS
jgi:hypothetical protein